jgi:quercetin dioxygenase-like cupin family protein
MLDESGGTMSMSMREEIKVGSLAIRFLVNGDRSGASVAVFEFDVPAGAKVAAGHSHDGYDETVYGLEGTLTWTIDGVPTDVGPGEALFIPRGVVHQFDNVHDTDARALAVVTPGILGPEYFREVAAVLDAAAGGPPDFAALGEVMRRHGLTCAD